MTYPHSDALDALTPDAAPTAVKPVDPNGHEHSGGDNMTEVADGRVPGVGVKSSANENVSGVSSVQFLQDSE